MVAHVDSGTCFDLSYKETAENILQIEIPYSLLPSLIAAQGDQPPLAERYRVPENICSNQSVMSILHTQYR